MTDAPMWRQAFDAAEKRVTPPAEQLVRTPGFALGAALVGRARSVARGAARDVTARAWHLLNLPAGSDVSRLRAQVGALDREVRRLTVRAGERTADAGHHPVRHPNRPSRPGGAPCPRVPSPQTVLDRVRRDVERNALRARNGIKLVAGVDRPGRRADAEGRRLAARPLPAVALPQRPRDVRRGAALTAAAHRVQPDQPQLHPRPDPGQQLRRAAARPPGSTSTCSTGASPTSATRHNRLEDYVDDYIPAGDRPGAASSPAPTRSTSSATASAATCRCSTPPTTPRHRCAA